MIKPVRAILVVAADSAYFDYSRQLLDSLRDRGALSGYDLGFYDLGLSQIQQEALERYEAKIVVPGWDIPFPLRDDYMRNRQWFRAMVARPFLPEYFPGYDCYLWIDSDAWVQDRNVLEELVRWSQQYGCAAVPEVDRSYIKFRGKPRMWEAERVCYRECFTEDIASKLDYRPQVNTGVLAISAQSPVWSLWKQYLKMGLMVAPNRVVEQLAFNLALYDGGCPVSLLPATYNWIAGMSLPAYSTSRNVLVEPQPPFERIKIIHLTSPVMGNFADITFLDEHELPLTQLWVFLEYDNYFRSRVTRV